jgi:Kef-type K+ transport system membrane component KefB
VINKSLQHVWRDAASGFSCGVLAVCLLFGSGCGCYLITIGRGPLILWYGVGASLLSLAVCLLLYLRLEETRRVFSRALLAGACVATLALIVAVCVADNLVGSAM